MTIPTFASQKKAWSSPPVDDIGYIPSKELLAMDDDVFLATIDQMAHNRYLGWRNHGNNWVETLKLDTTHNARILDYGCGVGVEALQYDRPGAKNRIWVADIAPSNLKVAERTFRVSEGALEGALLIKEKKPFLEPPELFDVIHCSGVLHHIPNAVEVVEQMHSWLVANGELRLMLYGPRAWKLATGVSPPDGNVDEDPHFEEYVHYWDAVGGWADWYDANRLTQRFGQWFRVEVFNRLTASGAYVGAVLRRVS